MSWLKKCRLVCERMDGQGAQESRIASSRQAEIET